MADTKAPKTPYVALRMGAALEALQKGQIKVPYVCEACGSRALERVHDGDRPALHCFACARLTDMQVASRRRIESLKRILEAGLDPFEEL